MIEVVVEELNIRIKDNGLGFDFIFFYFPFIFSNFLFFIERIQDKKDKVWYYHRSHDMVTEVTYSHDIEMSIEDSGSHTTWQ